MKLPKRKKRRIWLAGLLSLFCPGLGQIYCGRLLRGLALLVGLLIVKSITMAVLIEQPVNNLTFTTFLSFIYFPHIILSVDACLVASRIHTQYRLKEYNRWYYYLLFAFILGGFQSNFVHQIDSQYIQSAKIVSSSMFPTVQIRDQAVIYKNCYGNMNLKVGDIVQFPHHGISETSLMKRVVACEGDTIEIINNQLIINDTPLELTPLGKMSHTPRDLLSSEIYNSTFNGTIYIEHNCDISYPVFITDDPNSISDLPKYNVPPDCVFVLGDNRNFSVDSRYFGSIPVEKIQGKAEYLIWTNGNWQRWGLINSKKNTEQSNKSQPVSIK